MQCSHRRRRRRREWYFQRISTSPTCVCVHCALCMQRAASAYTWNCESNMLSKCTMCRATVQVIKWRTCNWMRIDNTWRRAATTETAKSKRILCVRSGMQIGILLIARWSSGGYFIVSQRHYYYFEFKMFYEHFRVFVLGKAFICDRIACTHATHIPSTRHESGIKCCWRTNETCVRRSVNNWIHCGRHCNSVEWKFSFETSISFGSIVVRSPPPSRPLCGLGRPCSSHSNSNS